jgi:hypothetical protein
MATSTSLRADFNWHPQVHAAEYEETLYFLLIRMAEARHRPVADQLRGIFRDADIDFACEYSVFGYWDALARVWLKAGFYRRLARLLKRAEISNVAKFETFVTTEIRYLWNGDTNNLLADDEELLHTITRRERDLECAARNPSDLAEHKWEQLITDGLVIPHDQADMIDSENNVKFYIALDRTGGEMPPEDEQAKVLTALDRVGITGRSSLYSGTSRFASYLIRCVADTYADVLRYSAALDVELDKTTLRPMTLLVANTDARESDRVNHPHSLPQRVEHTLKLLGIDDGPTKFPNLTTRDWDALYELVQRAHELADDDGVLLLKLRDVFRACLKNNHDELSAALAFISDSEWFFAKYMQGTWALTIGDYWVTELKRQFSSDPRHSRSAKEIEKPKDKWSLGNYAHFAVATKSFHDVGKVFDARLKRELMEDWATQVIQYAERRNEPAHGRLREISHIDAFQLDSLRSLLLELMDITALCSRCRKVVEARRSKGEPTAGTIDA